MAHSSQMNGQYNLCDGHSCLLTSWLLSADSWSASKVNVMIKSRTRWQLHMHHAVLHDVLGGMHVLPVPMCLSVSHKADLDFIRCRSRAVGI
jgi:hypothetical protein